LRRNVSAYVDDVVIHNKKKDQHIKDLRQPFVNLRKYGLMLNLEKCTFRVSRGKLSGCMVSKSGIEANLEKIEAIRNMRTPQTKIDI
jgi:translation initiation factor IF-2